MPLPPQPSMPDPCLGVPRNPWCPNNPVSQPPYPSRGPSLTSHHGNHLRYSSSQRLRPPRWVSQMVSATEATTAMLSTMADVIGTIYLPCPAAWSAVVMRRPRHEFRLSATCFKEV